MAHAKNRAPARARFISAIYTDPGLDHQLFGVNRRLHSQSIEGLTFAAKRRASSFIDEIDGGYSLEFL